MGSVKERFDKAAARRRRFIVGWDRENVVLQETTKQSQEIRELRKKRSEPIYQLDHVYFFCEDTRMLMSLDETWYLTYKDNLPDHVKALLYIHGVL